MTERMKYINIMGNIESLDYVIEKYVSKYDIQLENAIKELPYEKGLTNIVVPNPYTESLNDAENMVNITGMIPEGESIMTKEKALSVIDYAREYFKEVSEEIEYLKNRNENYNKILEEYEPFLNVQCNVHSLSSFEFINYQFGKMPITSFKQFEAFLYNDAEMLFVKGKKDKDFQWGVYFSPDSHKDKIDSIFSSLHFQRTDFSLALDEEVFYGTPKSVYDYFSHRIEDVNARIETLQVAKMEEAHLDENIQIDKNDIVEAYLKIKELYFLCEIRKYAAKTVNDFFIFVGWMEKSQAESLRLASNDDDKIIFIEEDVSSSIISKPPTKLKNNFLFKPFEFFVKMYGLPSYDEIDPTPFLAISYTLLFGIMFADVGQGAIISLAGFYLYKKKGFALGAILSIIGISSMFFGVIFGSFFGFEFHGILYKLTGISTGDNSSSMIFLIASVVIGVIMIILAISFNIANSLRQNQLKKLIFNPNGIVGLVFYSAIIFAVYLVIVKKIQVPIWLIILFIVLPIVLLLLEEPLNNLLINKKFKTNSSTGIFLLESVIGVFEILLSFFTNTLSFIRVGAFILSHVSIMGVILMLSKTTANSHNLLILVIGNLFVIGFEGLIVGIQALRIQFYEMFSRFYEGGGRPFKPYREFYK